MDMIPGTDNDSSTVDADGGPTLSNKVVDTQEALDAALCSLAGHLLRIKAFDDDRTLAAYERVSSALVSLRSTQCSGDTQELADELERLFQRDDDAKSIDEVEEAHGALFRWFYPNRVAILTALRTTHSPSEAEAHPKARWHKDMTEREIIALARDMCAYPEITAPVQGFPRGIPWEMHMRAYDAYVAKYREQTALINLYGRGCRGGFDTGELDMFIPGWRDELSERTALLERIAELEGALSLPSDKTVELLREAGAMLRDYAHADGDPDEDDADLLFRIHSHLGEMK